MTTTIKTEIIIHTNTFASSLGDRMCAYMTGECPSYDEDYPGAKEAEQFQKDKHIPKKFKEAFSGNIETVYGEYGSQYIEYLTTPGWFNHGMGQIYEDTPENEVIAFKDYLKAMKKYNKEHYEGDELKEKMAELKAMTKVDKYSSEQGICITFEMVLDQEQLEFLKHRAYEYAQKKDIKILSFEADEVVIDIKKTVKKLM
jgi:hypothetical protein